jgi:amidase
VIEDAEIRAWAYLAGKTEPHGDGPLAGIECGIKDIIDVAGMPTSFGVDFRTLRPERDAWCVARLREAGAVIRGKTVTTPFAFRDPPVTRNPWHADRTPGGSSSGSAAAVAAGHVPFAIGTQTIGSVLRPASFCGVVGFKPTYGLIPTAGVSPLAPSLDHVGVLARDVSTALRVAQALGVATAATPCPAPLRIGVDLTLNAERYGLDAHDAAAAALATCAARGAELVTLDAGSIAERAMSALDPILAYEMHRSLGFLMTEPRTPPEVERVVRRGATVSRDAYEEALARRETMRGEAAALFENCDVLALLCAGAAPSREGTGDPAGQGPWSFFGLPAIALPVGRSAEGLPLSLQLIAPSRADERLLAVAAWIERALASA